MPGSRGSSRDSNLLVRLEQAFWVMFLVLLTLAVVGQAALLTERGRERISRADRLEGVAVRVLKGVQ
ncbi:MAG: hypothetical protein ACM3ZO_09020 [Clostridia bacterium]